MVCFNIDLHNIAACIHKTHVCNSETNIPLRGTKVTQILNSSIALALASLVCHNSAAFGTLDLRLISVRIVCNEERAEKESLKRDRFITYENKCKYLKLRTCEKIFTINKERKLNTVHYTIKHSNITVKSTNTFFIYFCSIHAPSSSSKTFFFSFLNSVITDTH